MGKLESLDLERAEAALGVESAEAALWLEHMRNGEFEQAWALNDRRLRRSPPSGDPAIPRHFQNIWNGGPIADRRVLVRCYHGLGDTIQFSRYLPRLCTVARSVTMWTQPKLIPLLAGSVTGCRFLPLHDGEPEVDYDVDLEIMELPWLFRTTLASVPDSVPYLRVGGRPLASRLVRTQSGRRPRIGVVWRGGEWDARRSIPARELRPLLNIQGIEWISFQHDVQPGEWPHTLERFDSADLVLYGQRICDLDLLISVDSMPAHLAGALGVAVWVPLQKEADWRWMRDREDSPWYPTLRLFRQHQPGRWESVVAAIAGRLRRDCASIPPGGTLANQPDADGA
jgi:hypothetical protein